MVRDPHVDYRNGNWVFIPASCLWGTGWPADRPVVIAMRRLPAALLLGLVTAAVLGPTGGAGAVGHRTGVAQAQSEYRLTKTAVLLFDDFGSYVLLFRLNRDVPRAPNRRALAGVFLEESMSPALFGGGRRLRCFMGVFSPDNRTGPPRFGRAYRFRLEVASETVVRGSARLRHSTPGYKTSWGNAARDPKAAHLSCVRRSPSFAG